jgi:hypothetical protein
MTSKFLSIVHGTGHERSDHRIDFAEQTIEREHHLVSQPVELDVIHGRGKRAFRNVFGHAPSACQLNVSFRTERVSSSKAAAASA